MRLAVYPGTFDPVTYGHIDVIKRALRIFDKVIIAVAEKSARKETIFTKEERIAMIKELRIEDTEVESFSNLLVDYLRNKKINTVIRGLRAVSDFDREFQMAVANNQLYPEMETIFIMTDKKYFYLSSSLVRELAKLGGSVKNMVPENVENALKKKLK
jgi:pantetheine-phosphate adenylyltransferase